MVRATGVVVALGLAGCSDGGDGGTPTDEPDSPDPDIDEWLTETELGGAADNYDGTILDRTGRETVTVMVGAEGNGGGFAFEPAAVLVSAGTEVRWEWTGEGNPHNVEALPEEQLGVSDYEFSSGEPEGGSGVKFTRTMEDSGIALYHCEPHFSLGMKGAVEVR
jgi:halocyanin-like protein